MFEVGQWQTPTPMTAEPRHFLVVEMDAVGEPHAIAQPAALLEIVDRPAAEVVQAIFVFVRGLAEMGVQAAIVFVGETDGSRP